MRLEYNLSELGRLAEALACILKRGDVITLHGDPGAGKTTFARALITALIGHEEDIPSPTFPLVLTYNSTRMSMSIAHFDLYRLGDTSELVELGFDDAVNDGLVLVEWPERAAEAIPPERLELHLKMTGDPDRRDLDLIGHGHWRLRLERFAAREEFLLRQGWQNASISFMHGDASTRSYARLRQQNGLRAILMDAPAMADGPKLPQGKPYSTLVHLAEDVRPFVAIAEALRKAGISTPEIYAADLAAGLVLLEDLGEGGFTSELDAGQPRLPLWRAAVDVLIALRRHDPPARLPLPDNTCHVLPRFDADVMAIETQLLLDWYWPAAYGEEAPAEMREEFNALWRPLFMRLQKTDSHWLLRDYHSPNLLRLDGRDPPADIGVIDFQDALRGPAAYDLVSLLQDARVDVSAALEQQLFEHYCAQIETVEPDFDRIAFAFDYAALGAQRNTKILGIFARLARRDGKPQYLSHLPRIWDYLARDLDHNDLAELRGWYELNFPPDKRAATAHAMMERKQPV